MDTKYVQFKVELEEYLPSNMDKIYVVGNHEKLGKWNPKKAITLKRCKHCAIYYGFRKFPVGTKLSFKVIRTHDWKHVQLGSYCEELENLCFEVLDNSVIGVKIYNWKEE